MHCENCGCKVYNGHCVNCHEERYIYEQSQSNDEPTSFSKDFLNKVCEQDKEAKEIMKKERANQFILAQKNKEKMMELCKERKWGLAVDVLFMFG